MIHLDKAAIACPAAVVLSETDRRVFGRTANRPEYGVRLGHRGVYPYLHGTRQACAKAPRRPGRWAVLSITDDHETAGTFDTAGGRLTIRNDPAEAEASAVIYACRLKEREPRGPLTRRMGEA